MVFLPECRQFLFVGVACAQIIGADHFSFIAERIIIIFKIRLFK